MINLILLMAVFLDFCEVDALFKFKEDYKECNERLTLMLDENLSYEEKAKIYWRLSRVALMQGEQTDDKTEKREHFNRGIEYAALGIMSDPDNPDCYMWHCANVGRECQTHSLIQQASSVPVMTKDLTMIIDELGYEDYSPAWQALAEMYYHHPFKSDESALNFARKAAVSISEGELQLSTYLFFAELLYERDWSLSKRASLAKANSSEFKKSHSSLIEKYSCYDGSGEIMPWNNEKVEECSDREEVAEILRFAISLYESADSTSPLDTRDYNSIMKFIQDKKL